MIPIREESGNAAVARAVAALQALDDGIEWRGASVDLRHEGLRPGEWKGASVAVDPVLRGPGALRVTWAAERNQAYGGPRSGVTLAAGESLSVKACKIGMIGADDAPGDVFAPDHDRLRARLSMKIDSADGLEREVSDIVTLIHPLMFREVQNPHDRALFSDPASDLYGRASEFYNTDLLPLTIDQLGQRLLLLIGRQDLQAVGAFDHAPRSAVTARHHHAQATALVSAALARIGDGRAEEGDGQAEIGDLVERLATEAAAFGYALAQAEFEGCARRRALAGQALKKGGGKGGQGSAIIRKAKMDRRRAEALPLIRLACAKSHIHSVSKAAEDAAACWKGPEDETPSPSWMRGFIKEMIAVGEVEAPN